jgi:hypothetical protein
MDYTGAEAMLRKLLKLTPAHSAGTLQLARLLAEVHFSRAAGPPGTPQLDAVMEEVCGLYEKSIASNKEVGDRIPQTRLGATLQVTFPHLSAAVCLRND